MQSTSLPNSDDRFTFDRENQTIFRGGKPVQLSPKTFEVLNYLFAKPRQLVTKDELLNAVWADVCVVDAVLKNTVREIRRVFNDNPKSPRFIETVHRRGYRFIGEERLTTIQQVDDVFQSTLIKRAPSQYPLLLAGREQELATITHHWQKVQQGIRSSVAIKGGPGIGKSTLVENWLQTTLFDRDDVLIAKTYCISGNKERSYVPLFDAVDQLCKSPGAKRVRDLLFECAPSLSAQMPWLTHWISGYPNDSATIKPESDRLLLEATEFIERLTQEKAFVWFIDDVHRCDADTRDLLSHLLRREGNARLFILTAHCNWNCVSENNTVTTVAETGVYEDASERIHLECLKKLQITEYLKRRFSEQPLPANFADNIYKESSGHPLFVKGIIDKLVDHPKKQPLDLTGHSSKPCYRRDTTIPAVIRRRMDAEIVTLGSEDFRMLQAASVAVVDAFSAAAVATLLDQDIVEVEDQCDELARTNRWIRRLESRQWPDGTLAQLYGFSHPVYRDYLYQTLPAARRRQLHLIHAERLESAYGVYVAAISKNLAYHFELGGHPTRVVRYKQLMQQQDEFNDSRFDNLKPHYHRSMFTTDFTLFSQKKPENTLVQRWAGFYNEKKVGRRVPGSH